MRGDASENRGSLLAEDSADRHHERGVGSDLERAFAKWVPDVPFRHSEGNSPAHFLSEAIGTSVVLVVEEGRPRFGRWQGVFLLELDGPRSREVAVDVLGGAANESA